MLIIKYINLITLFHCLIWIFFMAQIVKTIDVKYLGCYADDSWRMLDERHDNSLMTLEMCKKLCINDRYLGLQNFNECYCGDSLGGSYGYRKVTDTECYQACVGNSSQICGGPWRNSVYEFIITPAMPTTKITTPGQSTVKTIDMTTPGQSTVKTINMTTPGPSTAKTIKMTTQKESTVTTTEQTIQAQTEMTTSVMITECLCPCCKVGEDKWDFLRGMNLTLDQLADVMEPELYLMRTILSINKSNTTRMRRSKTSASDDRVSAKSIGFVGVVFICLITALFVFFDIHSYIVAKFKRRGTSWLPFKKIALMFVLFSYISQTYIIYIYVILRS